MRDLGSEFLEAALPVGDLGREQVLMVVVERFALEIFVGSVSEGHGGTREHVFDPSI